VNPQRDIDLLKINELTADLINLDINVKFFNDFDISDSVFVGEPHQKFEVLISEYDFKDVNTR
jgi:hypothetical protein